MQPLDLDLWVYFAVGIPALALFVGAGIKTVKDKQKKKAKEAAARKPGASRR